MISSEFPPSIVEINSLGIGLLNTSNIETLDLTDDEFLVVGERNSTGEDNLDKIYNMLVNRDGVAINTSRRQINALYDMSVQNAGLYVDDNIVCTGNIITNGLEFNNIKFDSVDSNVLESVLKGLSAIDPLFSKGNEFKKFLLDGKSSIPVDNIFTTSYITLGGIAQTQSNAHPLNITATANNNVNNMHIVIKNLATAENKESAKVRIGNIGNVRDSPAIITTTCNMPMHFHVSTNTATLNRLYAKQDGYPDFARYPNDLPALCLDKNKNVGIGTTESEIIEYSKYVKVNDLLTIPSTISEYAKIKVKGSAHIDNIITYDYFTKSDLHLDDIYVRKLGRNFTADQIVPGEFLQGNFVFNSNLYIGHTGDNYTLEVNNELIVNGKLQVSNLAYLNNLEVNNAIFNEETIFDKNIQINNDVILGGDIHVNEGDLFIGDVKLNLSSLHPIMVSIDVANASNIDGSNVLIFATNDVISYSAGSNFMIPGRLGVGLLPSDEYNEKMNIIKRNPKQFELLLQDSSQENTKTQVPQVYMGHLDGLDEINSTEDNSFIINTNRLTQELHNIYFYPGVDLLRRNVNKDTPTLTIHQNNSVGINTSDPKYALDVNGEVLCKDIYVTRNNEASKTTFFIKKRDNTAAYSDVSKDLYYLYDETGVNKFCINFVQKQDISLQGLNVKGGIHAVSGGYYENNTALATMKMMNANKTMAYTNQHLTIGWQSGDTNIGDKPLNIRNLSENEYNDSIIRVYRGNKVGGATNSAIFSGIDICDYDPEYQIDVNKNKWFMYKNHIFEDGNNVGPLQFGYTNNSIHPTHYGMTMYFNKELSKYYVDINNPNQPNNNVRNRNSALAVYGDLEVHGNINIKGTAYNYKKNDAIMSLSDIQNIVNGGSSGNGSSGSDSRGNGSSDIAINDVVITGNKVAIMSEKTLAVGQIDNAFINYLSNLGSPSAEPYNVPLTVYQKHADSIVARFVENENIILDKNSAAIEIGVFNTTVNNYSGVKKNTVQMKVSNYSATNVDSDNNRQRKSVFDVSMYNSKTQNQDNVMSIYHDCFSSYVNIGMKNNPHQQQTGTINIQELANVALHVQNHSKYLLQLTNNSQTPAINLHRAYAGTGKFWIVEGPNTSDNFGIKYAEQSDTFIPDETHTKNIMTLTKTGRLGLNIDTPTYTLDVIGETDRPVMNIANTYTDISFTDDYSAIEVMNSNLKYDRILEYTKNVDDSGFIYNYKSSDRTYYSGINYSMSNIYFPNVDIYNEVIPDEFINHSNFIKTSNIEFVHTYEVSSLHDIQITSNNIYIRPEYGDYTVAVPILANKILKVSLNTDISILPDIFPLSADASMQIKTSDIVQKNATISTSVEFQEPNQATYGLTRFVYEYNHVYDVLKSTTDRYAFNLIQNGYNLVQKPSAATNNKILYTSNTFETYLGNDGILGNYDSMYLHVNTNTVMEQTINFYKYDNYIITSNLFIYNSDDEYELNILANIKKYYNYYSEISGPSTIVKSVPSNVYTYDVSGPNNNKTIELESYTEFLNSVPYGAYDGFSFENNIVRNTLNTCQFIDSTQIFNSTIVYNINLYDMYSTYDFGINNIIRGLYLITKSIDYHPHIILRNNFNDNKGFGKTSKIYSKNGGIEFAAEDEDTKKMLLNINKEGDVRFGGSLYADDIIIQGNIYDRLGNSMLIDYSENMYDKAFIMQSSNYILYTSNYSIHSTSNIQFVLQGKEQIGFTIVKPDIYNYDSSLNDYDLFRIYEAENTAFIIKNGGKIGIKAERPRYELDIEGDMYASNIYSEFIHGNGMGLREVNLVDRDTSMLKEGNNLYYTPERVGVITSASNIQTSNYIRNTSNELGNTLMLTSNTISTRITLRDTSLSNYVNLTSNELGNTLLRTSNVISTRITNTDKAMSNYVNTTSNELANTLQHTSNVISTRITNTDKAMSNYVNTTSNELANTLQHTSNVISTRITNTDKAMSNYVDTASNELANTLQYTSNVISTRITNTDRAMSNYVNTTSNELGNTLQHTSNVISTRITNTDKAMSNYVDTTSNELANTLQYTSNTIITRITNVANNKQDTIIGAASTITSLNLATSMALVSDASGKIAAHALVNSIELGYLSGTTSSIQLQLDSSNLDIINTQITNTNTGFSNYIQNVEAVATTTSNVISERITVADSNMSNYIGEVSGRIVNDLNTDIVPEIEGAVNRYYKESYFNNSLATKTLDNIAQGTDNKYIENGSINVGNRDLVITGDVKINGKLTTIGGITTNDTITSSNASLFITGETPEQSLRIFRPDTVTSIMSVSNYSGSVSNADIFHITGAGNIGIGTYPTNYKLDVNGSVYSTTYSAQNIEVISKSLSSAALKATNIEGGNIAEFANASSTVVVIKNSGNIGLGTAEPQSTLDVHGSIKLTGNLNTVTNTEIGFLSGVTSAIQTQLINKQATIIGAASSITVANLATSMALVSDTSGKVTNHATVTGIELGHLSGVTSAIQTQLNNKQATITGAASSITVANLATSMALVSDTSGKVTNHATVTSTELGYLDGVTSGIQGQLDSKQATIVGAASTITVANLATSMALVSDTNGKVTSHATVSSTELGYLDGVTSAIQGQLNNKQATIIGAASSITGTNLATSMALVSDTSGKVTNHATVTGIELGHLSGVTSAIQTQLNNKQATIIGAASSITGTNLATSMALVSDTSGKVTNHATVTGIELGHLSGVTSAIQTQLNNKQATIIGAASTITVGNLATSMALVSDTNGKVASHATVSSTELGHLSGVTSAIQTQLNSKEATIELGSSQFVLINTASGKVGVSTVTNTELDYVSGVSSSIQEQLNSSNTYIFNTSNNCIQSISNTSNALVEFIVIVDSNMSNYINEAINQSSKIEGVRIDNSNYTKNVFEHLDTKISILNTDFAGNIDTINTNITDLIQNKQATITGAASSITVANLATRMALVSDTSGKVTNHATVTGIELGHLSGVTSAIQTQLNNKQATITGAASSITSTNLTTSMALVSDTSGKVTNHATVTGIELGHLSGVTSAIQTQLNNKQATIIGAASSITSTNLTTSMALVSDTSGKVTNHATVTGIELGHLSGVTSAIQTQLNNKQATITGAASSITSTNLATSMALVSDTSGKVTSHATVTGIELGHLSGVTSAIQTQLNNKQATITGAASSITGTNLATSMALVSDTSGKVTNHATVTGIELGHLSGVTSAIQTQLNNKQATITGAASSITSTNLATSMALVSDTSGKVTNHATVTGIELGHLSGVTSAIQTQLNNKQATITGAASSITSTNLATSMALVSDTSGKVTNHATVTGIELGHLSGVTSAIQTQLNNKQATIIGAASSITGTNLATSMALVSDTSGKVAASTISTTLLNYLSDVSGNIGAALASKQNNFTPRSGLEFQSITNVGVTTTYLDTVWTKEGNNIYNNNTGNVGIGTIPELSYKLDIYHDTNALIRLMTLEAMKSGIFFCEGDSSYYGYRIEYDGNGNRLYIIGHDNNAVGTVQMAFARDTGNVGIGTEPHTTYKLDVNGAFRATSIVPTNLTENSVVVSDANKQLISSSITPTQLGYLTDVTENIGAALASKQNNFTPRSGLEFQSITNVGVTTTYLDTVWTKDSNNIYNNNTANVGIGTNAVNTASKLHIHGKCLITDTTNGDPLIGPPTNGIMGGSGTRLVLQVGSATDVPYAIGINTSEMWYSVPTVATGTTPAHKFYVGTSEVMAANLQSITVNTFDAAGTVNGTDSTRKGYLKITGNITASGDILSTYSDIRLKTVVGKIENPLEKIDKIETFKYVPNALASSLNVGHADVKLGVSAQDVKSVLPEVVSLAPFDTSNLDNGHTVSKSGEEYLTVSYERLVPLLIECIKELKKDVNTLKDEVSRLQNAA